MAEFKCHTSQCTADDMDYVKIIESTVMLDHQEARAWEHVFSDPALKLRLEKTFRLCAIPNILQKQDGISTNGILLYGWSGTGKTLLAKAVARQFASTFYNITMGDIIFRHAGQSESFIGALFSHAISSDSAATAGMKSAFLSEWQSLQRFHANVVVLGTSSRPELIDGSFLDMMTTCFLVSGQEPKERTAMLEYLLSRIYSEVAVADYHHVWKANEHIQRFTGANMAQLVRNAIGLAEIDNHTTSSWAEVEYCGEVLLFPVCPKNEDHPRIECSYKDLTPQQRQRVARRPVKCTDLVRACRQINATEQLEHEFELKKWDLSHGTSLDAERQILGRADTLDH